MLKWMRSAPPTPLAVLLAAMIASRREMPSPPSLANSAAIDVVVPFTVSLVLVTKTVLKVSSSVLLSATSDTATPL